MPYKDLKARRACHRGSDKKRRAYVLMYRKNQRLQNKKRHFSGTCICTHSSEDHHGSMVMNIDYSNATGENRIAGECEFYGCNEDTDGHCGNYWDKDNPEPEPELHAKQRPDPLSIEVRDIWYLMKVFRWALEDISESPHGTLHCDLKKIADKTLTWSKGVEIKRSRD